MQRIIFILGVIVLIGISSCHKPNNNGTLVLKFNPLFGGVPMTLNTVYKSPDARYYNFENYKFYLSHIKLVRTNGTMVEVNPVAYISLDDSYTLNIPSSCPPGGYTGIQFYIGLDPTQNNQPVSSDSTSPFYENLGTTWGDTVFKYVFIQVDGLGAASNPPEASMTYHIGTDPYYTSAPVIIKNFTITSGQETDLNLNADLLNVFYGSKNAINILTNPNTETVGDTTTLPRTFINDFSQIFSLQ